MQPTEARSVHYPIVSASFLHARALRLVLPHMLHVSKKKEHFIEPASLPSSTLTCDIEKAGA
jgi:hypothetical protein